MTLRLNDIVLFSLLLQCLFLLSLSTVTVVSNLEDIKESGCPFWHIPKNGRCECGAGLNGVVMAAVTKVLSWYIKSGYCVTWSIIQLTAP